MGSHCRVKSEGTAKFKSIRRVFRKNPDKIVGMLPLLWVVLTAPTSLTDGRTRVQLPSKVAMVIGVVCAVMWLKNYTVYEYLLQAIGLRMFFCFW